MGKGKRHTIAIMPALAMLAACQPDAPAAERNAAASDAATPAEAATPAPVPVAVAAADAPLRDWLVGSWSFEPDCASDYVAHYEASGSLDNSGEVGSWTLAGDQVTETIRERFENGGEAPVKVDPPETRSYTVARRDATHGEITIEGRKVPMLRC